MSELIPIAGEAAEGAEQVETREKTVPAVPDSMPGLVAFLEEELVAADCPQTVSARLMVCHDEIVSNVIKFSGAKNITVRLEFVRASGMWRLTFIDSGFPWNPLVHADPDTTLSAEERPIGGLGILMVKKLMDDVRYMRDGDKNVLTMTVTARTV